MVSEISVTPSNASIFHIRHFTSYFYILVTGADKLTIVLVTPFPLPPSWINLGSLAAESLGAWHPTAIAEVQKLGSSLARQNGEEEATVVQQLFQQLSVSLMRGNAALFNNRCPPDSESREDDVRW